MNWLLSRVAWTAFLTVSLWALVMPPAHAYIDPASGSFFVQILVAGVVGGALAIKTFGRRIWGGIRSLFGKKSGPDTVE